MTWTGQAEELLSAVVETGLTTAGIVAAAWRAGVDPDATDGLAGAALWMHARPKDLLTGGLLPVPSDREMIAQAVDVATDTGSHLAGTRALSDQVTNALNAAVSAATAAAARARDAKTKAAKHAATRDEKRAQEKIADCESALELLIDIGTRLNRAFDCLERVPDDLLATYLLCYEHRRNGGTFPISRDFLTGVPA